MALGDRARIVVGLDRIQTRNSCAVKPLIPYQWYRVVELVCGASILVMKKDGCITINGKDIDVVDSKHVGIDSNRIVLN